MNKNEPEIKDDARPDARTDRRDFRKGAAAAENTRRGRHGCGGYRVNRLLRLSRRQTRIRRHHQT